MYNHRKVKSSFFLIDNLYPERILSRHKYYRKSGFYFRLKSRLSSAYPHIPSTVDSISNNVGALGSKLLLKEVPNLYLDKLLDKENMFLPIKGNAPAKGLEEITSSTTHLQFTGVGNFSEKGVKADFSYAAGKKINPNDKRGLFEMENNSFTNGLLKCGHRYLRVSQ